MSTHPVTESVARAYGDLYATLRDGGEPLPANDIWIAATAMECGGSIVTFDTDFQRIEDVDVIVLSAE